MKNKIINLIATAIIAISGAILMTPASAYADICGSDVAVEIKESAGCFDKDTKIESVIGNVLESIIGILGLVAVGFIIYGGIQYMTSSGDSAKAKKARDTILYACIGLVVAALAFAITNFAINAINSAS